MTDLTNKTIDELRAANRGEVAAKDAVIMLKPELDELARRAQANDLVQAERDEFDEELHTCRAIVRATSEHLHVDLEEMVDKLRRTEADAHSWQELATARAQANDALRSAAQAIERTVLSKDGQVRAYNHRVVGVLWQVDDNGHQFMNKMPPVDVAAFRAALAAAPAPSSSGAPTPAPADSQREAAIEFNTNGDVWVRLTDLGRRALLEQHDQFWTSMGRPVPTYVPPQEVDGWSRWQLWSLMGDLGHLCGLGRPVPFETVMRFSAPPAPVAPVTDADTLQVQLDFARTEIGALEARIAKTEPPVTDAVPPDLAAALAWWGDGTEPKTMAEAAEKARSYRNDAHELADVSFELRNQPEGNPADQVRRLLAPVTDAEVEAAIEVWPMVPICVFCSKVLSGAAGKDAAFATAAKHTVECAENPLMRERDEANRRVAKAESDRAYLDEKLESIEYALADDIKGEHGRVDGDSVLRVIARRVAEARGAGLRELRARLVDFCRIRDRGYDVRSDFSPLWVLDEIDRLLAAPPASKLAEEPKWTPCPSSRDGWICIRRAGHTGAHESVHRTRWPNDACAVCKGTGQVEGTAGVVIGGKATMSMRLCPECSTSAIDRLRAKLAEEPAQEDDGPCLSALLANMRMEMSDGANGMRTPREEAIAAVVECVARRIEALERAAQGGGQ